MRKLLGAPRAATARLAALGSDEQTILLSFAVGIGLVTGLVVTVFYKAIDIIQAVVLVSASRVPVGDLGLIPLTVAIGLAASYALVRWGAHGSAGENVPDVMYRVSMKSGVIDSSAVAFKTLAAALVVGTGGSVGAEGPVIVAGAAAASRIGRWLKVSPHRLRTLVGCGAAAGISAAFNAPIAGVIFGIEKILGAAGGLALGPFVVASVIAATVSRWVFGNQPVLALPADFGTRSPWEFLLYALLGGLCGVVSVMYSRGTWKAHDLFARIPSAWRRILLGALIVGTLDVVFQADLWGRGHESLDLGIMASRGALFLLALAAAKLVATAVTLGAGGVGGVFTPALFIGATLGGALGVAARDVLPGAAVAPGAVALVGMAGLVSGATHAPLTAIMMVFEMTGDYGLIMPLMLTSVIAYVVARRLHPESIYTEWLARRGVHLSHGADAALLARVPVSECVNRAPVTVLEDEDLETILHIAGEGRQTEFPVVTAQGKLWGMLSQTAIREALSQRDRLAGVIIAADLATEPFDRVTLDDSLFTALRRLGARDVSYLPVVRSDDHDQLVGVVSRQDLLAAYERRLTQDQQH